MAFNWNPGVITAFPVSQWPIFVQASVNSLYPASLKIAPHTPPPAHNPSLAALTTQSTSNFVTLFLTICMRSIDFPPLCVWYFYTTTYLILFTRYFPKSILDCLSMNGSFFISVVLHRVRLRHSCMAVRWYSERSICKWSIIYTGGKRQSEWTGCLWVSEISAHWNAKQSSSGRSIRYRQSSALVKRTARAVPFKKEQKKVPQTLM